MQNGNGTVTLENSSVVFYQVKHTLALQLSVSICQNKCPNKHLYGNTYCRFIINNCPKLEIIKNPNIHQLTREWLNNSWDIHAEEYFSDTCKNIYVFQMHYAKWKKPDLKGYILYGDIYMIFWKRQNYRHSK